MYPTESGENISKSGVYATNQEIKFGFRLPVFNTLSVGHYTQLMRLVVFLVKLISFSKKRELADVLTKYSPWLGTVIKNWNGP